jgi:hypothetical protein
MYLAGLVEDPSAATAEQLESWVRAAYWSMLAERCVAVLASKTKFAVGQADRWIADPDDMVVCAGYAVYNTLFTVKDDAELDLERAGRLLDDIAATIHSRSAAVQYAMKNFIVMAGIYSAPLFDRAMAAAVRIGRVDPVIAKNSCNIQSAVEYLLKYQAKGWIGRKIKNSER